MLKRDKETYYDNIKSEGSKWVHSRPMERTEEAGNLRNDTLSEMK